MGRYVVIALPAHGLAGRVSGECDTAEVNAESPRAAAGRRHAALGSDRTMALVVDLAARRTYAYRRPAAEAVQI